MRVKLLAIASAIALASVLLVSSPASADKPAEPESSGVVVRSDAIGGHGVGPATADVGGEDRRLLVIVGWDDSLVFCNGGPPVFNGVQQVVATPSGNVTTVVHNGDVPVLVFDVTDVTSEEDFFISCGSGDLAPLATGTVKQRPIIAVTDSAVNFKVKSRGVVTDAAGRDWTLQMLIKERYVFESEESQVLTEWVKLTLL